jgi:hypothetical protein
MLRTAFASREGQGARAGVGGGGVGSGRAIRACSLACVSVAACLNFQARRSCRARFSESSEPKGRFGRADPHCRGEPSSQHARQPGSAAAQGPRRCR